MRTISLNEGLRICTDNNQIKKFTIEQGASSYDWLFNSFIVFNDMEFCLQSF